MRESKIKSAGKATLNYEGKDYELSKGFLSDFGTFPPNEGNGQQLFL